MNPIPSSLRLPAALLCLLLSGCATTASSPSDADPWERVNRSTYAFNDAIDRAVLKPVAKGYRRYVPQWMRTGVTNFLSNLAYPTVIVNNVLQLKLMDAVSDTTRLVLNTTFGLGGLFDPASKAGLPRNDEDFGQTLGYWGMPSGPYVVIPFLGPSTLRDAPSLYVDYLTDARHYLGANPPAEAMIQDAFDPYAVTRNAYLDRREYQVRDGDVEPEDLEFEDWPEEEDAGEPAPAPGR